VNELTSPAYRLRSALARLRALGLTEAWRLLPAWWSPAMLRGPSAEALTQEVIGELAAMTGVSAVALYEPGAAVTFRTRVRWKSRNCAHFEPSGISAAHSDHLRSQSSGSPITHLLASPRSPPAPTPTW